MLSALRFIRLQRRAARAQRCAAAGIGQQRIDRGRQRRGIAGRDQDSPVTQQLGRAADCGGDDRAPGGHGLHHRVAHPLVE